MRGRGFNSRELKTILHMDVHVKDYEMMVNFVFYGGGGSPSIS